MPQFSEFLERYLFGTIRASGKKNQKKSEKIRLFSKFFGRYLVKAKVYQRWQRQFFAKSSKKFPQWDDFWKDTCFGDDRDFCWIVKKIEKSSKFFGHFGFFLEDTYTRAEKGINNISHARKEKNGNNGKKSDHFRIFVEDTCTKPPDGNVNNNAQ